MTDEATNVIQFPSKEELAKRLEGVKFHEFIFTNDQTNPFLQQILHAFYDGVLNNKLGVMQAKDAESGDLVTLLVGLVRTEEGGINCFPLAKILDGNAAEKYLAPDGNGGWVGEEKDGEQTD